MIGGVGPAARRPVEIRRAGQPRGQIRQGAGPAAPEVADAVTVPAVPLAPHVGEAAQVIAVRLADVPRLGDQLHVRYQRILRDEVEESRDAVERAVLASQRDGEVEPEAVDVHLAHPVAERVHHQPQADWGVDVEAVARARRVEVVARLVRRQAVVGGVVEAAKGEGRAQVIALRSVVEDHVEDDLDAGRVERPDHRLELGHLPARLPGPDLGRVAGVRGEEAQGAVAPVVREPPGSQEAVVDVVVDRQQLDRGNSERPQVVQGSRRGEAGVGPAQGLRNAGMSPAEALDVGLVDDRVGVGDRRRSIAAPVEAVLENQAARHARRRIQVAVAIRVARRVAHDLVAPLDVAVYRPGIRIEEQLVGVAAEAQRRLVRPDDAVAVALTRTHARHEAVPHAAVLFLRAAAAPRGRPHRTGTGPRCRRCPRPRRSSCPSRKWSRPTEMASPAISPSRDDPRWLGL